MSNHSLIPQVFLSHTKKDEDFCDKFDRVCARVGVKSFRSEFENIPPPPHKTIINAMNNSIALFFLVGKELVKNQKTGGEEWGYTQNWIAFEIGLACQRGIDVWAICDDVLINFPMPYINNYLTVSLRRDDAFSYMRFVLNEYVQGRNFSFPYIHSINGNSAVSCPYPNCKMEFNLHVAWKKDTQITCPQCLRPLIFKTDRQIKNDDFDFKKNNRK